MKTKRIISILMTVVMMLSVVFCVVPSVSATTKKLPTVKFVATIDGRDVSGTHNLYQFNSYNVKYYLMVGSKIVGDTVLPTCFKRTVVKASKPKSVYVELNKLFVNKGDNKKVKISVSRKVTDSRNKIIDIYNRLLLGFYTKDEALAIRNYLLSHCGKTINTSFYVNPMPFKAKVVYVKTNKKGAHVRLECLTPLNINVFTFLDNKEFDFDNRKLDFWGDTMCDNMSVSIKHPSSKTLCNVKIKNNYSHKVVHTIKVAPCNLARYGYVLSGK